MIRSLLVVALVLVPSFAHAELRKPDARRTTRVAQKDVAQKDAVESLTVDGMLTKINSVYMFGMQRCYVRGLAENPSLSGKVTVELTVDELGRVSGAATGSSAKVDACLGRQLAAWRFPAPRDAVDKPTQASFKISLVLRQ